jgi:hypothetical protein
LEEAHSQQQEAGIDFLEKEKIDREVAKRMKAVQLLANRANVEQAHFSTCPCPTCVQEAGGGA